MLFFLNFSLVAFIGIFDLSDFLVQYFLHFYQILFLLTGLLNSQGEGVSWLDIFIEGGLLESNFLTVAILKLFKGTFHQDGQIGLAIFVAVFNPDILFVGTVFSLLIKCLYCGLFEVGDHIAASNAILILSVVGTALGADEVSAFGEDVVLFGGGVAPVATLHSFKNRNRNIQTKQ